MEASNLAKRRLFEVNVIVPFSGGSFSARARHPEIIHQLYVRSHTVLFLVICRIQASSRDKAKDVGFGRAIFYSSSAGSCEVVRTDPYARFQTVLASSVIIVDTYAPTTPSAFPYLLPSPPVSLSPPLLQ